MPPIRRPITVEGPSKSTQQPSPGTQQQHAPGSIFAPKNAGKAPGGGGHGKSK